LKDVNVYKNVYITIATRSLAVKRSPPGRPTHARRRATGVTDEFDQRVERRSMPEVELIQQEVVGVDHLEAERLDGFRGEMLAPSDRHPP